MAGRLVMRRTLGLLALWLLCLAAGIVGAAWMLAAIIAGSPRAWRLAIAFDQLANTAAGGDEDETISARCWRARDEQPYRVLRVVIDGAARWAGEVGHCEAAHAGEVAKAKFRVWHEEPR